MKERQRREVQIWKWVLVFFFSNSGSNQECGDLKAKFLIDIKAE